MTPVSEKAKHTPGPWAVDWALRRGTDGGTHGYFEILSDKGMFWVAKVLGFSAGEGMEKYKANARLMAAAPELLEALKELLPEGWGDDDTMDHIPGVKKARMAIAKAEGTA